MHKKVSHFLAGFWLMGGLITGCASNPAGVFDQAVLDVPVSQTDSDARSDVQEDDAAAQTVRDHDVPRSITRLPNFVDKGSDLAGTLDGDAIEVSFRNMPLPDFINTVFGQLLGFNFVLDPSLSAAQDLVTLSLSQPMPPAELYRTARSILAEYGVALVESGELLRFRRDNDAAGDVPLLVTGATLPEVPAVKRRVFSMLTLEVVRNAQVRAWLQDLYRGTTLEVKEDGERNTIILSGPLEIVKQATETAKLLDQPFFKGKFSRSFSPNFVDAKALVNDLQSILSAEGYSVSQRPPIGGLLLLPLQSQDRLIVFAASQATLQHVIDWAYNLDTEAQDKIVDGFFSYEAKNVTARHIAELVDLLRKNASSEQSTTERDQSPGTAGSSSRLQSTGFKGGELVVDENRNVIFFSGPGKDWRDLLELMEEIDKPIPMVVIDVLLAEITLSDSNESGVEWLFRGDGPEGTDVQGSTIGGTGIGGSGLSLIFDSAGETRALVNAFYSNDRAVIRSSPKLLVKSGEAATIDVGNQIPIITSNSQSTDTPGAPVIQSIQYRKTGVLLEIAPVVQSGGLVDLKISQELSEQATSSATLLTGSPTILTRRVRTSLALKDGGSVLLGGLISDSTSTGTQGVPGLGQIPVLGKLFRTDIRTDVQTELLMLVSVYVINSPSNAVELTDVLKQSLFQAEQ